MTSLTARFRDASQKPRFFPKIDFSSNFFRVALLLYLFIRRRFAFGACNDDRPAGVIENVHRRPKHIQQSFRHPNDTDGFDRQSDRTDNHRDGNQRRSGDAGDPDRC